MDIDEADLNRLKELTELKTDVAIIKQRVDGHDDAIDHLELIVSELDEDIKDMRKELNDKLDTLHRDALTSVPEWAARELKKTGMSTGTFVTIIVGLATISVTLLLYVLLH